MATKNIKENFKTNAKEWYKQNYCTPDIAEEFANAILNPKTVAPRIKDENRGITRLFSVSKITRSNSPYAMDHDGKQENEDLKSEKHICKRLFRSNKFYEIIGKIIDYETPMRNTADDEGIKGIDMLSYNSKTNTLFLLETKNQTNSESLLRASLEVFTYWKITDHQKLLYDFSKKFPELNIKPYDTLVKKAVLLFKGTYAYKEYVDKISPKTIVLMKELGVDFYGIREEGSDYVVFDPNNEK